MEAAGKNKCLTFAAAFSKIGKGKRGREMERKKSCCFTGHRPQRLGYSAYSLQCAALKEKLRALLIALIEKRGYTHFISGMALGVDLYAAQIVLELKQRYPQITLECVRPCAAQAERWPAAEQALYNRILSACDRQLLLQAEYTKDCMQKRNRYMVDHADCVLAVWNGTPSGTGSTIRYARTRKVPVVVVDPLSLLVSKLL